MSGFQWLIAWSVVALVAFVGLGALWDEFGDGYGDGKVLALLLGGLVVLIAFVVIWVGYFVDRQACEETGAAMKRESRYDGHTGCLITDGDREIPLDNWYRNEQSGAERD